MDRQLIVMLIIAVLCAAAGFFAGCAHESGKPDDRFRPTWLVPSTVSEIADAVRDRLRPTPGGYPDWFGQVLRESEAKIRSTIESEMEAALDGSPGVEHDADWFRQWLRGAQS